MIKAIGLGVALALLTCGVSANAGNVTSHKTGATTSVAARYAAKFQAYVDKIEATGARVLFMGGIRRGSCAIPRHKHPCGMALDVCQKRRGVVDPRCHLPGRSELGAIASSEGLAEGGAWRSSDYGHAEIPTAWQLTARAKGRRHHGLSRQVLAEPIPPSNGSILSIH